MITGLGHQGSALQGYADTGVLFTLHRRALVVCRIILGENQGGGTGFLIGKDLIMTNNHVLSSLEVARTAKAQFFYTKGSEGIEVGLNPDNFFYTSPTPDQLGFEPITTGKFDFTIVSIKSHPKITEVSHLAFSILSTTIPKTESNANIIHHPIDTDGMSYQKVSFRENLVKEVTQFTIHYTTTTMPGSSGAPVIDDEGNLIALHRATCTQILKALLKEKMLTALLEELFPGIPFVNQTLTLGYNAFPGRCATIDGSLLYIFSEGELKGHYYHQGKMESPCSLFVLVATQHTPAKGWALQFLNNHLEEPLGGYHKECNTAVPIKPIRAHLQINYLREAMYDHQNIGLSGDTPLLDFVCTRYKESQKSTDSLLKERYVQHYGFLPLILTNAAFPIQSFFTQLSIVSHVSQEKKEEEAHQRDPHLVEKDSLREIHARLCTTEKSVEINNLFDPQMNKPIKRILVLGRAGIGKSTLCQKIAYDWASGTLFNQKFELIYHIKLRDFNAQKKFLGCWLSQMIAESCYEGAHQEKIFQELKTNSEKILLIFDGWDEASPELTQALESYFLQTKVHYLLTSRPGVTSKIQGNFDLIVENMGFTQTQVEIYTEKFFAHTQCVGIDFFLNMLRSHNNLLTIAHIPIQLQILCALWQKGEQKFPQTLTLLFSKIIYHLFEWEQSKNTQKEKLTSLKHLFLYQALGEVALKGLDSKQLIIPNKLIEDTLIEKSLENCHFENNIKIQDLLGIGLIKECGINNEIYFLHLTYQEYSIAYYISSLPKSSLDKKQAQERQRIFVQTYRYRPEFHLVMRMLAGCIWEDSNKDIKTLETFFEWLYSGHTDLVGSYQTEVVLSCLDECSSEKLEEIIWERYKIADFVDCVMKNKRKCLGRLMAVSKRVFRNVMRCAEESIEVKIWFFDNMYQFLDGGKATQILDFFLTTLCDRDSYVNFANTKTLGVIAAHVGKENIPHILKWIQPALTDESWSMRREAVRALVALAAHAGRENIPQILNEIQTTLRDPNVKVCNAATKVFGAIVAYAGKDNIPQILNWLQRALEDQYSTTREAAAEILGTLAAYAGKENIFQILNGVQTALKDQNWLVRMTAAEAFGAIVAHAGKENIPQALNGIHTALRDQKKDVRRAAIRILEGVTAHVGKENFPQVLNLLQIALSDQDFWVRNEASRAFRALSVCSESENIFKILYYLQTALQEEESHVRETAAEVLGEIAAYTGKENIPAILNWLQTAQKDQKMDVRKAAFNALRKVAVHAEEEGIPQILNGFQVALSDPYIWIRRDVSESLGTLAAYAGEENISQILIWLQTAQKDPESHVRMSATISLGKIAAYAGRENIPLILGMLQMALRDPDHLVHWTANEALGKIAAYVGKKNILQILNNYQRTLKDLDRPMHDSGVKALVALAAHAGRENIPQILSIFQMTLLDQNKQVRKCATRALGEIGAHVGTENIPQILNVFQTALRDRIEDVRWAAIEALEKIAAYAGREGISQILDAFHTALSHQDYCVRDKAAKAIPNLKAESLLSVFTAHPLSLPKLIPIIFEHFSNQAIPLYLIENSRGCSLHISDTCYEILHPKQMGLLSNRCMALRAGTWTKSTEETCTLL